MASDPVANHDRVFSVPDALTSLASELPPETVRIAERTDGNIDGASPSLHVHATRPDDVAATLAICNRLGAVVAPRGGGTHLHIGTPPDHVDVVLDLRMLNRVIAYHPEDLTLAVAAGTRFTDIQQRLAESGQTLALDPRVEELSTIGGIIATNRSGPRRARSGTARDVVIGLEVAGVNGAITKSGGMVVKNVTGYDLSKAHIGALGTLGVITRVNLKVMPTPTAEKTLVIPLRALAAAGAAVGSIVDLPIVCSGLDLIQRPLVSELASTCDWVLAVRIPGTTVGVDDQLVLAKTATAPQAIDETVTLEGLDQTRFWTNADDLSRHPGNDEAQVTCRMSTLSSQVPSILSSAAEAAAALNLNTVASARAIAGITYVRATGPSNPSALIEFVQSLRASAEHFGGTLVIESAPLIVKQSAGVWGAKNESTEIEIMERLRTAFDPGRILNRGRFVVA